MAIGLVCCLEKMIVAALLLLLLQLRSLPSVFYGCHEKEVYIRHSLTAELHMNRYSISLYVCHKRGCCILQPIVYRLQKLQWSDL